MRIKRLISLALVLALMLTLSPLASGSHADEKKPTAEDFEIIPLESDYDDFYWFSNGLAGVKKDEKWGYINEKGKVVINIEYDRVSPFYDGLAIVQKQLDGKTKCGLINKYGKFVLPLEYNHIELKRSDLYNNSTNLYEVDKESKFGIVNHQGQLILPLKTGKYTLLLEDRISKEENGKTKLYDISGKLISELPYLIESFSFSEGLAIVKNGDKAGYIDKSGKLVIPFQYSRAEKFVNGLAKVEMKNKNGYIDKKGKVIIPIEYEESSPFLKDFYITKNEGKRLLIEKIVKIVAEVSNNELADCYVFPYEKELSEVRSLNGRWGLMDNIGKLVVPCEYTDIHLLDSFDYYWVTKGEHDKYALIDKNGKLILPFIYDRFFSTSKHYDGHLRVWNSSKGSYGFINDNAELVISDDYNDVSDFKDGVAWVKKGENDLYSLINKKGQNVLSDTFSSVHYKYYGPSLSNAIPKEPFSEGKVMAAKKLDNGRTKIFIIRDKRHFTAKSTEKDKGYVYDEADKGEGLVLPTDELANVTDKATAAEAVTKAIAGATEEQKKSATGTDLLTLYGEEAALRAAKTEVEGSEFIIDKASVEKVENTALEAKTAVEGALKEGGVTTQRSINSGVLFEFKDSEKLSVKVDASSAEAKVGNVRVETPTYSLSFNKRALASIKEESAEPLEITVTELPAENAGLPSLSGTHIPSKALGANILEDAVSKVFDIKFSKKIKEKIKLSLPVIKGNPNYQAVYDSTGKAIGGKYNPVTKKLDVKINKSDKYVVKEKKKSFADITSKSKEMQDAIEILASKGIIAGTSPTNFSPDGTITRAEIAALILRSISKLNPSEKGGFSDVTSADWYFGAVGSAKKHGIMNGVSKTHFAPKKSILKDQIVAVAARVLKEEMGYLAPAGPEAFLGSYTDVASIPNWAKSDVALATREGLVVKRYDSAFIPASTMTRGDVAVILHRLFKKLW